MPTAYKNAQLQGTANLTTYGSLYTTGASTTAVISSIVVTNTASVVKQYRVAIMPTPAGTPAAANWIVYDGSIAPNDAVALTLGLTMSNSQVLRVSSTDANVTFSAYISEIA